MCKTIGCAKNNRMCNKKTVYWDLINSDMNRRDVQTGYSGYVHKKKTGDESMDVFSVTIL